MRHETSWNTSVLTCLIRLYLFDGWSLADYDISRWNVSSKCACWWLTWVEKCLWICHHEENKVGSIIFCKLVNRVYDEINKIQLSYNKLIWTVVHDLELQGSLFFKHHCLPLRVTVSQAAYKFNELYMFVSYS